jgi:sigma-E factor negative regulatory protein RseB
MSRALGLALVAWAGLAHAQISPEALDWLRKIYAATQKLSYTGTFVYQRGVESETSRITRLADAQGDLEKLEVLDGLPREIVRDQDTVSCYLPESQIVKVDRRGDRRGFPALLPEQIGRLADNYKITLGGRRRIAGFDCREIVLAPRDGFRYGYRLWADRNSGMLLKAVILDEKGEAIEHFTFTQLTLGPVPRDKLKPSHATGTWRIEDASVAPANLSDEGWGFGPEVLGFRKIAEVRRKLGDSRRVGQVVYSDGLAAVSVFVEPADGRREPVRAGLAANGAMNIFTREVARFVVTAVGEAPAASVERIANVVEFRPR